MGPKRKRKKDAKVEWSDDESRRLLMLVLQYILDEQIGVDDLDEDDWKEIAEKLQAPGKTRVECIKRLERIHQNGNYFSTIDEVFQDKEGHQVLIDQSGWEDCNTKVCRGNAPDFRRVQLEGDTRNPREFVNTLAGARLDDATVRDTVTTVNDLFLPVDVFGKRYSNAEKAHLLPKASADAITWNYPVCAVLGLDTSEADSELLRKAILGSYHATTGVKYPGIRNLLSNIVCMQAQGRLFDSNPNVMIFPARKLDLAKAWKGEAYDAIVICSSPDVARAIGMSGVPLSEAQSANLEEINAAFELASEICQFLAHSVLQKSTGQVNCYQNNGRERQLFKEFRSGTSQQVPVPHILTELPMKPVFKISFAGHNTENPGCRPLAPDPMLLAFKSSNNWCRRYAGFRMVAGAEPKEDLDDDDLSEEGRESLKRYLAWEAAELNSRRHDDIMEKFGGEPGISVS